MLRRNLEPVSWDMINRRTQQLAPMHFFVRHPPTTGKNAEPRWQGSDIDNAKRVEVSKHNICIAFEMGAFDRRLALKLCGLYGVSVMSTVTVQQFQQDLATWLGVVGHGEPVLIVEQGRVIAQLTPPDAASLPPPVKPKLSMDEWLDKQDEQMKRIFGDRIIADSSAVLNDIRGD